MPLRHSLPKRMRLPTNVRQRYRPWRCRNHVEHIFCWEWVWWVWCWFLLDRLSLQSIIWAHWLKDIYKTCMCFDVFLGEIWGKLRLFGEADRSEILVQDSHEVEEKEPAFLSSCCVSIWGTPTAIPWRLAMKIVSLKRHKKWGFWCRGMAEMTVWNSLWPLQLSEICHSTIRGHLVVVVCYNCNISFMSCEGA